MWNKIPVGLPIILGGNISMQMKPRKLILLFLWTVVIEEETLVILLISKQGCRKSWGNYSLGTGRNFFD
jgi:hypothetical protein